MKESQIEILEYLAKFKYLTISQLHQLGVLKNKTGIYQIIKPLKDGKYNMVDLKNFGVAPVYGKLESFYFLTKHGVKFLQEELFYENEIKYPLGQTSLFSRDYFHRKFTIDFYINFFLYLNKTDNTLIFADYYFDKLGSNRTKANLRAKNHISIEQTEGYLIPDMVFKFNINEKDYLFLFEQHNGKDTKKLIRQLQNYILILETGAASIKYNFDKSVRVVIAFEQKSIKDATMKRLSTIKEFYPFINFFIFKTNEEIREDFFSNWCLFDKSSVNFV